MSERIHAMAQLLLGKSSMEERSIEELQHLTNQHPYFAPAQFLLLQKLEESGSPGREAQQRKAVLYYHDPLLFDYFVSSDKFFIDESIEAEKTISFKASEKGTELDEIVPQENTVADEQSLLHKHTFERNGHEHAGVDRIEIDVQQPVSPEKVDKVKTDDQHAASVAENENSSEEKVAVHETTAVSKPDFSDQRVEDEKHVDEELTFPAEATDLPETSHETTAFGTSPEKASAAENHGSAINSSGAQNIPAHKRETEALTFEPFHTVDYFASQGIKISAEELPKDKLGKQLRSFTEWLKTMKRLPASELSKTSQSYAEKNVENMASHSVADSNVITETMAEVWIKQGNREKAIETYNKLSLLNPSKKAYFAAKIENLNQS